MKDINLPDPELQILFTLSLRTIREQFLQDALLKTIERMDITEIDSELASFVPKSNLAMLAKFGLRGELIFAVPSVLRANPHLLGYYRLLLGYSQKEFYSTDKGYGVSRFKTMEQNGKLTPLHLANLEALCRELSVAGSKLLAGVGAFALSRELLDDLTLLTLGPQLRGGANNKLGQAGILLVFEIIKEILEHSISSFDEKSIEVLSPTGRKCQVICAADPDIVIQEEMSIGNNRNVVAIEVKSGTDVSNLHNRVGEAEKSHQKARGQGYTECWTIINVNRWDEAVAKSESPSTNRFYNLAELATREGDEYEDFRMRICSLTAVSS